MSAAVKRKIPPGLKQVRKELPPPGRVFRSKKTERRKQTKEQLRRELKESLLRKSS